MYICKIRLSRAYISLHGPIWLILINSLTQCLWVKAVQRPWKSFYVKVQGHIRPLYKIFAYILSPYLYLLNKKKHLWVKAKKYISKVIADVFEIQCWIIISFNLAQPYSNFTKRLPEVNRFEVMLDQGFRSIFRRSPWIIFVGRIFSLPLAQHCSEFT